MIRLGSKSSTWIRVSTASTVTSSETGWPVGSNAREVDDARKLELSIRRPRSGGAT